MFLCTRGNIIYLTIIILYYNRNIDIFTFFNENSMEKLEN